MSHLRDPLHDVDLPRTLAYARETWHAYAGRPESDDPDMAEFEEQVTADMHMLGQTAAAALFYRSVLEEIAKAGKLPAGVRRLLAVALQTEEVPDAADLRVRLLDQTGRNVCPSTPVGTRCGLCMGEGRHDVGA